MSDDTGNKQIKVDFSAIDDKIADFVFAVRDAELKPKNEQTNEQKSKNNSELFPRPAKKKLNVELIKQLIKDTKQQTKNMKQKKGNDKNEKDGEEFKNSNEEKLTLPTKDEKKSN